jgi:DNA-binding PadR family transcriptional regulator
MDRPLHGYELKSIVEDRLDQVAQITAGTLYYTLKKLEKKQLLERKTEREGNRPERQVYEITDAGRAEFQRLLSEGIGLDERAYYVFDAALYFYEHLDKDELLEAIEKKRDGVARFHQQLAELEELFPGRWPFHLEMLRRKAHLISGALDTWYRELEEGLQKRRARKSSTTSARA